MAAGLSTAVGVGMSGMATGLTRLSVFGWLVWLQV